MVSSNLQIDRRWRRRRRRPRACSHRRWRRRGLPRSEELRFGKRDRRVGSIACPNHDIPDILEISRIVAADARCGARDEAVDVVAEAVIDGVGYAFEAAAAVLGGGVEAGLGGFGVEGEVDLGVDDVDKE